MSNVINKDDYTYTKKVSKEYIIIEYTGKILEFRELIVELGLKVAVFEGQTNSYCYIQGLHEAKQRLLVGQCLVVSLNSGEASVYSKKLIDSYFEKIK